MAAGIANFGLPTRGNVAQPLRGVTWKTDLHTVVVLILFGEVYCRIFSLSASGT